jgi:hypothetical protein
LAKIMMTPITDDMDPIQRVWLEIKKKITHDRDVWFTRSFPFLCFMCIILLELWGMPERL